MTAALTFDKRDGEARVLFEPGALSRIAEVCEGARILLIASANHPTWIARVKGLLGERCVGHLDEAPPHVPLAAAQRARAQAKDLCVDTVIALGGGSAIGMAKAIALELEVTIVAVPTTYAGSEMTPIYGISRDGSKETGRDERVRPKLVVYDVELSSELPIGLSMTSGLNAMAHAVEALYAAGAEREVKLLAQESLASLATGLRALRLDPASIGARSQALYGAHLAGYCLARASMGLHHKLAHVIAGGWNLPHASTHAALLPHAVAYNAIAAPAAMDAIADALGASRAAQGLYELVQDLGVEPALDGSFGEAEAARATEQVMALASSPTYRNPAPLDATAIRGLIDAARSGRAPGSTIDPLYRPAASLVYQTGFHAPLSSEARPGALPRHQNSPRKPPYGLHAEQINGTGFTVRRSANLRSWMYRIRPSVLQSDFVPYTGNSELTGRFDAGVADPNLGRWKPLPIPEPSKPVDFVDGLTTFAGAGDPELRHGLAIHLYAANASMRDRSFYNADGDLLVVPQMGRLRVRTELGLLEARPGQILVLPRGLKFSVGLVDGRARGYVLEVFDGPFQLPERGPIGANGLSDERHFQAPVAAFDDLQQPFELIAKTGGRLYQAQLGHCPYDVVAWHGTLAPYRYDLSHYNAMGTVSFDHPDPSILTVLTVPFDDRGNNLADFVIFPGRWDVAEDTLRPPYFHRNVATEFNGIVSMDAPGRGFEPGCYFFTPSLTAHGVAASSIRHATERSEEAANKPIRGSDASLWVMFESILTLRVMPWHLEAENRDRQYRDLFTDTPIYWNERSGTD